MNDKTVKKASKSRPHKKRKKKPAKPADEAGQGGQNLGGFFLALAGDLTQGALELARKTGGAPFGLAKNLLLEGGKAAMFGGDKASMMRETGAYVRDLREVAGLTVDELGEALQLGDRELLEEVEQGKAALPIETILRMSALLARHDPVPFVLRLARSYNPDAWQLLENFGVGRLPVQFEREREFVNIFRGDDRARAIDDDEFRRVLAFTRSAFELAMGYAEHNAPRHRKAKTATKTRRKKE